MTTEQEGSGIRVQLIYARPGQYWSTSMRLEEGAVIREALAAAGSWLLQLGADAAAGGLSIHGRVASPDTVLRDGDRLEVLRPLSADPKQSRRDRALNGPGARKR